VSQLGYMFVGLGVGAYAAAIFHLFTHAFFKALLFLGSGSVMHAVGGDVDITKQGKLFGKIRWTAVTFIIGSLALAGVPLMAGFFSKEAILGAVYEKHHYWIFAAGMAAAGGTAFYVTRAVVSVFFSPKEAEVLSADHGGGHGDAHGGHGHGHGVHESPWVMLGPLVILAVMSVAAGYLDVMGFLAPVFEPVAEGAGHAAEAAAHGGDGGHHVPPQVFWTSIAMAVGGILGGLAVYQWRLLDPDKLAKALRPIYLISYNKFYVDEIYRALIILPVIGLSKLSLIFDLGVIDGIVNWWGRVAKGGGESFSVLQSGNVRDYIFFMSLGVAVILGVWLWM
jgi:NADH-quinone oxidoreductase subunit L